jgi:hypothetical protein
LGLFAAGWRPGGARDRGHGPAAVEGGVASFHPCHRCHTRVGKNLWSRLNPLPVPPSGCCHPRLVAICESTPTPLPHRAQLSQISPCLLMGAASPLSLENQSRHDRG